MSSIPVKAMTVQRARQLLDSGGVSAVELTEAILDRIDAIDPLVQAFVTVTGARARRQASEADERISRGNADALTGIPMQLKDNMATKGVRTTCSSRMLANFVPPYDATVTRNLFDRGAVLVGKGNLDEFAMGSSTENSAFFPTHNPWNIDRVPGGSSGGPAAAVASGECVYALGSDTGGSIRQPASFCGVVGLKPTYGLVSRYGLVAFASSLDQIGPITKNVEDAAIVLNAIAGPDPRDATSIDSRVPDYTRSLTGSIEGLRVGIPKEYFVDGVDPGVEASIRTAIETMEGMGAIVAETSLPSTSYAMAVYYIVAPSEASANLARYDGVKYGYSVDSRLRGNDVMGRRYDDAVCGNDMMGRGYDDAVCGNDIMGRGNDDAVCGNDIMGRGNDDAVCGNDMMGHGYDDAVGSGNDDGVGMTTWDALERTRQDGFGAEVKRRIMLGTYALSAGYYDAWYKKALQVRTLIRREFDAAFQNFDVLVSPTSPTVAFPLGEKTEDPYTMYLNDVFTQPANIAGIPAISVPAGMCDGLPVGLQFMASHFQEAKILRAAYAYEQATEWHTLRPEI